MAISKIIVNGETHMDVTQDTVAANNLLVGKTATGADGNKVNGAVDVYDGTVTTTQNKSGWVRPDDWPDYDAIDISDEECMFFTYDNSDRNSVDFASFGATCAGGFTVERGYLENGIWSIETSTDMASNGAFAETLPADRDFVVYKLKPSSDTGHITNIKMRAPSTYNGLPKKDNWLPNKQKCVERYGNLPYVKSFGSSGTYDLWGCNTLVAETELSTASMTSMVQMFSGSWNLRHLAINWNTSNVTSMDRAFENCIVLDSIDTSKWDTGKVTNLNRVFNNCRMLSKLDVSKWDVSHVTTMADAFNTCTSLKSLDTAMWELSSVQNMNSVFSSDYSLEKIDTSNWDMPEVTSATSMFYNCKSLKRVDLSKWVANKLTNASYMFSGCTILENIKLFASDSGSIQNIRNMFSDCVMLMSIDLSSVNTENVTETTAMCMNCSLLRSYVSGPTLNISTQTFQGCSAVTAFIFNGDSVPSLLNVAAFNSNNFANGQRIRFKASLVDEAKAATNWSTYADYIEAIQE